VQVLAHLHTHDRAPVPYLRYLLYKEFGWTPEQVRAIPLPEIQELFVVMGAVAKYENRPKPKRPATS
jgi:hypothetical protein